MFDNQIHKCSICGLSEPDVAFYFRKSPRNGKLYPSSYCKEDERKKAREAKKARYHDPVKGRSMKASAAERASLPENKARARDYQNQKYDTNEGFRESRKQMMRDNRVDPVKGLKIRERASLYYQNNKAEIQKRMELKRVASPKLRIRGFMRGRINEALMARGLSKKGIASLHYLPYSWEDMYRHIESQFEDWMTFSNYGAFDESSRTWQIDHVIPQAFFPYELMDSDLFRTCWSLQNLRPLESIRNLREGNREDLLGPVRDIRDILREIREAGIPEGPLESPESVFAALSRIPPTNGVCGMGMNGLRYLDRFFLSRFRARTANFPSVLDSMQDDSVLFRVILHLVRGGHRVTPLSVFQNLKFVSRTPGHFFPSSAVSVIKACMPAGGRMFDPFLGWGGRTLGALCVPVSSFVGCDLQSDVVQSCQSLVRNFAHLSPTESSFHHVDALSYLRSSDEEFDLVFSSPPFMNTEDYGVESDAMRQDWLDDFVFPFTDELRRHLSQNGRVALHLKDLKGAATFTAYHSAMKSAGFVQESRYRYGRTWTQAVYVYRLPNCTGQPYRLAGLSAL